MRTISSSEGEQLHFPDRLLYAEYKEAEKQLYIITYKKIREKYGVWATNQNKFVSEPSKLKEWDSRYMESLAGF
jgi:hypothetical protein